MKIILALFLTFETILSISTTKSPPRSLLNQQKVNCDSNHPRETGLQNIDVPINYIGNFCLTSDFRVDFDTKVISEPNITKTFYDQFTLNEELGTINYEGNSYKIERLDLFSPSLHTLSKDRSEIEMQVKAKSGDQSVTAVFLFDRAEIPFPPLYKLGVGGGIIKKLPTSFSDPRESSVNLDHDFDLSQYVDNQTRFIRYNGNSVTENCEPTTFLILYEKLWASADQIEEFEVNIYRNTDIVERDGKKIEANFKEGDIGYTKEEKEQMKEEEAEKFLESIAEPTEPGKFFFISKN